MFCRHSGIKKSITDSNCQQTVLFSNTDSLETPILLLKVVLFNVIAYLKRYMINNYEVRLGIMYLLYI